MLSFSLLKKKKKKKKKGNTLQVWSIHSCINRTAKEINQFTISWLEPLNKRRTSINSASFRSQQVHRKVIENNLNITTRILLDKKQEQLAPGKTQ